MNDANRASLNAGNPVQGTADQPYGKNSNPPVVSGYTMNGWFFASDDPYGIQIPQWEFLKPSGVRFPSTSPIFGDGIWINTWPAEGNKPVLDYYDGTFPNETGSPSGAVGGGAGGIGRYFINRHGGIPPGAAARVAANIPPGRPFPGAINIACFDGHADTMMLWQWNNYTWHKDWAP
jgi:hypothetical protein